VAKFTVITHDDHNLLIEADRFVLWGGSYLFQTGLGSESRDVASVPSVGVFAVVNQENEKDDFYYSETIGPDYEEDEENEPSGIDWLLNSETFYGAVADIIYDVLGLNDEPEDKEVDGQVLSVEIPHAGLWSVAGDGSVEEVTD